MDINFNTLDTLFRGWRSDFKGAFAANEDKDVDFFCTTMKGVGASTQFPSLMDMGQWREWIGPRQVEQMASQNYEIRYALFEKTFSARRTHIEDDTFSMYSTVAADMGRTAALLKPRKVFDLLQNGESEPCYDGQNFFDTNHPVGEVEGDQVDVSNIYTGDGSNAATPFYIFDTNQVVKPLIAIERRAPEWVQRTNLNDPHVFDYDEYLFGGSARYGFGFGLWQTAFKVKAATTFATLRAVELLMWDIRVNKKDENGRRPKMGINPNLIVCGAANAHKLQIMLNADQINSSMDPLIGGDSTIGNPFKGRYKLVVVSWLP